MSLIRISTATGFLAAIALGWSSLAAPAHADWAEDFEDYSIDQVLNGVGGWARSGAVADKIQQNLADSVNSSKTWNLTHSTGANQAYANNLDEPLTGSVRVSFDVHSNAAGNAMNIRLYAGSEYLYIRFFENGGIQTNQTSVADTTQDIGSYQVNQWYRVIVNFNLSQDDSSSSTYRIAIHELLDADAGTLGDTVGNLGNTSFAGAAELTRFYLFFPSNQATNMNIDNISVAAIPEPASVALVLGGVAVCVLRHRRRAA